MLATEKFCTFVGGAISPLLANIVLNKLDWQLHEAGYQFVRYADDFVVVCQDQRQAQEALALVKRVLEDTLGLNLSTETKMHELREGLRFPGVHSVVEIPPHA